MAYLHADKMHPTGNPPRVSLPLLESLDLTMQDDDLDETRPNDEALRCYLQALELPALVSLRVWAKSSGNREPDVPSFDWHPSAFRDFASRSPLLQILTLELVVITEDELLETFQLVPNLQCLRLSPYQIIESSDRTASFPLSPLLFSRLTLSYLPGTTAQEANSVTDGQSILLPKLTHLHVTLNIDDSVGFSETDVVDEMAKMAESRLIHDANRRGISRLIELEIDGIKQPESTSLHKLIDLRRKGLSCHGWGG
jgi:hypothetical protein